MGGSSSPPTPAKVYNPARDGTIYEDQNRRNERDRQLELAAEISGGTYNPSGYQSVNNGRAELFGQSGFDPEQIGSLENWIQKLATPEQRAAFDKYNASGATRVEYAGEMRANKQAADAEQAEADRKSAIASGRGAVDSALSSYDDNYFSDIANTMRSYYMPELEEQFGDANDQLTYKLARQGITKSKAAGDERAKVEGDYRLKQQEIENRAADAIRQAKDNVAGTKGTLYNYAETAADPAAVDSQIASQTGRLNAFTPELTPLGQIFTDYATPIVNAAGTALAGYDRYSGAADSSKPVKEKVKS